MTPHVIDQEARDMARNAIAQISAHEDVCAVRWKQAIEGMAEIKGILKYGLGGVITTLLGLVGWLASRAF